MDWEEHIGRQWPVGKVEQLAVVHLVDKPALMGQFEIRAVAMTLSVLVLLGRRRRQQMGGRRRGRPATAAPPALGASAQATQRASGSKFSAVPSQIIYINGALFDRRAHLVAAPWRCSLSHRWAPGVPRRPEPAWESMK